MHSGSIALVSALVATAALVGLQIDATIATYLLVMAVVFLGVPHGGLDHWTGRSLLSHTFPRSWAALFFSTYLAIAVLFAVGWWSLPVVTLVMFFILSAWHFGIEDDRSFDGGVWSTHLAALAIGGMVIWVPVLIQTQRFESILSTIIPVQIGVPATSVIFITRVIAGLLLPIACFYTLRDCVSENEQQRSDGRRNVCFLALFAFVDPIVSFGIYFCGWHSVRGLTRLGKTHGVHGFKLAKAVLPLSIGAVVLSLGGLLMTPSNVKVSDSAIQILFIGLSAIAVPHLLLHGPISNAISRQYGRPQSFATNAEAPS